MVTALRLATVAAATPGNPPQATVVTLAARLAQVNEFAAHLNQWHASLHNPRSAYLPADEKVRLIEAYKAFEPYKTTLIILDRLKSAIEAALRYAELAAAPGDAVSTARRAANLAWAISEIEPWEQMLRDHTRQMAAAAFSQHVEAAE